jgi:Restriction endonuclease
MRSYLQLVFAAFRSKAEPEANYSSTSHCAATTMSFALVRGDAACYANPQLLMQANSPDRGRDISCERVFSDTLSGTRNQRVIIQAKHWLSKPVRVSDLSETVAQVALWEPPKVHVLIMATSGRFTADAVSWIERHNDTGAPASCGDVAGQPPGTDPSPAAPPGRWIQAAAVTAMTDA